MSLLDRVLELLRLRPPPALSERQAQDLVRPHEHQVLATSTRRPPK
jgi:hypothetical protein